jgi:pimeloyl-ACP methyl ester carboxylesterase
MQNAIRMRITNRLFILLLLSVVDVFFAGAQEQNPPPPGKLFDAGGHKLHLNIQGSGSPAVIFENGSGDFSFVWSLVQPAVAKFAKSVSYDRAGFAWSEPGPSPRSGRQIAFELHTALLNAGIKGPYILVGQSFGGFLVRNYARFYPNEVAGIVLVEALHENSRIIIGKDPVRIREWAKGLTAPEPQVATAAGSRLDSLMIDSTIEFPFTKLPKQVQQWQVWAQSHLIYRQEAGN